MLVLDKKCLFYEAQNWKREVLLEDLLGIEIVSLPPSNNPNACEVVVHYYPVLCNRSGKKQGRKLLTMPVQFSSEATLEENIKLAEEWKKLVLLETQRVIQKEFCGADEVAGKYCVVGDQGKIIFCWGVLYLCVFCLPSGYCLGNLATIQLYFFS